MKKVCFFKLRRKTGDSGFEWFWEDLKPNQTPHISELITSLHNKGYSMELSNYDSINQDTSVVCVVECIDMDDIVFLDNLKKIFKLNYKKLFIELVTYDHQEVSVKFYDFCRAECDRELYFIDKNLIDVADDILYFDNHSFHVDMYVPHYLNEYKKINKWCRKFGKANKGLFLSGHIRFHKIQLLNFLYENNLLDENFLWSSTDEHWEPSLFNEFVPQSNENEFRNFKILERIPNMHDYDLFDKFKYNNYSFQVNHMHYFNSYFEVIPETQFYHREYLPGTKDTRKDWNNFSEKTLKALLMDHPFVMVSKVNTLKYLTDKFGFDISMDNWMHEYDTIENDSDRMNAIQSKLKNILSMSKSDLHDLYYEYFDSKDNYSIFVNNFYNASLTKIYNKF